MCKKQGGEDEGADHLDILRAEQHFSAVQAVRENASYQRKENDRKLPEKEIQAKIKGIFRQVIDKPALCELLNKGPDGGATCSQPHEAEVAVQERPKGTAKEERF